MKRSVAGVAMSMAIAVVAACSSSDTPEGGTTANRCPGEIERPLRAWARAGFSGSVAIATSGRPECLAAYGSADRRAGTPNTVQTVFSIGSISKAFTAAAVLSLVDAGRLSLDDRVGDLVPPLAGPVARATIRQLLLHISGLSGSHGADHEPLARDAAVAAIGALPRAFEPGSDFLYSNAGYTLLAVVVEEASGVSYRRYLASEILSLPGDEPAGGFWDGEPRAPGPRAVGYSEAGPSDQRGGFAGPHWALDGNGDLAMTMESLARWTHALFTGDLLSAESTELISAAGFDMGGGRAATPGWVALDESAFGAPLLISAGGGGDLGHQAVVAWLPRDDRVIAIASNTPHVSAAALLKAIGPSLLAGRPPSLPEAPAGPVDRDRLAAAAGIYALADDGSFEVSARRKGLAVSASGGAAIAALFPLPSGVVADAAAHEEAVRALLAGETLEGRKERAALASSLGPIEDVELTGTVVEGEELRSYVRIAAGRSAIVAWYALDEHGQVQAAEAPARPPRLLLSPAGSDRYRPYDPAGARPDVTVEIARDRMVVTGPSGVTRAGRTR